MADNEGLFTEDVIINEEDLECNKVGVPNITETQNPNQDIQELDKEIQRVFILQCIEDGIIKVTGSTNNKNE